MVGAGLAGAACAAALARDGWQVTVLSQGALGPDDGSSQPWAVDHIHLSPDDNPTARLTRYAAQWAGRLARSGSDASTSSPTPWAAEPSTPAHGKLLVAIDAAQAQAQRSMLARLQCDPQWARAVEATEAQRIAGLPIPHGGLWLPQARVDAPIERCAQWLSEPNITSRVARVHACRHDGHHWHALDPAQAVIARGRIMVIASAADSVRIAGLSSIPVQRLAGQTTLVRSPRLASLACALGGPAYACPVGDGRVLVGSTFAPAEGFAANAAGDADNLARLAHGLGLRVDDLDAQVLDRFGGMRCATRDRMPVIGALPDEAAIRTDPSALRRNARLPMPRLPGLYAAFGLGSRGLLLCSLAAELLASIIGGRPPPIPSDLVDAVDPARFIRAALRRGDPLE